MSAANIYDQHSTAFATVSAYVILKGSDAVARVALKHGMACTAYVHWLGVEMAKGRACGGGYDKPTAAVEAAVQNAKPQMDDAAQDPTLHTNEQARNLGEFRLAILAGKDGHRWDQRLRDAGFTVLQAV